MRYEKSLLSVALLWLFAACTCEVQLGSPGASDDGPVISGPAPVVTQQAAATHLTPPVVQPLPPAPTPTGVLSEASIRKTLSRHKNELRFCAEQEGAAAKAASVRAQFIVKADGSVDDEIEVLERTNASDKVTSCFIHAVKRWRFVPPKGGPARVALLLKR